MFKQHPNFLGHWGKVFLGPLGLCSKVLLLPRGVPPTRRRHASHSAISMTVKFGPCPPLMWEM